MFNKVAEAKLWDAEKARRDHGVKDGSRLERVVFAQQPQVVIRAVHDQLPAGQSVNKRREVNVCERVDDSVGVGCADLDETDFLRIGMKAVRFSIYRNPGGGFERVQVGGELLRRIDHFGKYRRKAGS